MIPGTRKEYEVNISLREADNKLPDYTVSWSNDHSSYIVIVAVGRPITSLELFTTIIFIPVIYIIRFGRISVVAVTKSQSISQLVNEAIDQILQLQIHNDACFDFKIILYANSQNSIKMKIRDIAE
jgi:hypothetical protein